MPDTATVIGRNPRVEYQALATGEGGVLLHLDTAAYHAVNEVGGLVWRLLDPISFGDLLQALRGELKGVPPTFDQEIGEFLDDLAARDLVFYNADGPAADVQPAE
jgi:hypothetical protein